MPPFFHGKDAQVFITDAGGTEREVTAFANETTMTREVDTAEASTFADDDKVFVVGLRGAQLSLSGFVDATIDGYLVGLLGGTPRAFKVFPSGSAAGRPFQSGSAILTNYEVSSSVDDAVQMSAEFQVSGAVTRGTV